MAKLTSDSVATNKVVSLGLVRESVACIFVALAANLRCHCRQICFTRFPIKLDKSSRKMPQG